MAVTHEFGHKLGLDHDDRYEVMAATLIPGLRTAVVSEAGIPFRFSRVCTQTTIPYARHLEDATLPNTDRILSAAYQLLMQGIST